MTFFSHDLRWAGLRSLQDSFSFAFVCPIEANGNDDGPGEVPYSETERPAVMAIAGDFT